MKLCIYFIKLNLFWLFVLIKILELFKNVFCEFLFWEDVKLELICRFICCMLILIEIECYILLLRLVLLWRIMGDFFFVNVICSLMLLLVREMLILVLFVFVIFLNNKIFLLLWVWNFILYLIVFILGILIFMKDLGFLKVIGLYFFVVLL